MGAVLSSGEIYSGIIDTRHEAGEDDRGGGLLLERLARERKPALMAPDPGQDDALWKVLTNQPPTNDQRNNRNKTNR